jgi:hypothetical protein
MLPTNWYAPFRTAALVTGLLAAAIVVEQRGISAAMAGYFGVASAVVAARRRQPPGALAATIWFMFATYQLATWWEAEPPWRFASMGVVGWLVLGLSRPLGRPSNSVTVWSTWVAANPLGSAPTGAC